MPQTIKISPSTILLKSDPTLPLSNAWFDPEFWRSQHALAGTGNGRGAVWFIDSEFGKFVIRRYRRGGLIAKFNKSQFFYTGQKHTRPWLELSLLEHMRSIDLPVPRPIGGIYRLEKGFYQAELLTATIDNANDLFDLLKSGHSHKLNWKEIGAVIKRFHDNGIYHSDLNCHNIMIDQQDKVWLIDFDKCEQRPPNPKWQQDNLDRLKRSLDKESNLHSHFIVSDAQWRDFMEGYRG
ncbi:3-deoxy-D-manno-octulosonic acid kinase [Marinomonas sp. M1K-6]|uniref:3-deoxy-D-manno-octulosonic acid kinase n=1 Tax=Marinomonas profundi TaxID=2726122 RepID=A0A847QYS7_9GAMM|nr:3-deoxy-D-manno-octulosonic acid kinase [Marinomonas profundi]NLQ16021.1 3-deoxy-D-manno-octulosonic acid kinase [Marinomonas profundi]UDV03385.1 3-deoxy-D-manno-octulosonic acid kinase [Marinomonas profundi]